jgi:PAS domain S-box-containing protein
MRRIARIQAGLLPVGLPSLGMAMVSGVRPTQREVFFDRDEIIVSKTDAKGRITYANCVFQRISGYTERELLGQPHSIIRHPDMPRAAFKLLWDTVLSGQEIFAYVKNITKTGDYYWVLAHVTPSFDGSGKIVGFHSNRRVPSREALKAIIPLYAEMLRIEAQHRNGKEALAAGYRHLIDFVTSAKKPYEELVLSL